jgi:S1-C subfamily serine protease
MTRGLWFGATVRGSRPPLTVTEIQRGSPADTAGLEPGDEVLSVNGKAAKSSLQFYREVGNAGRDARLVVLRGDQRKDIAVRLLAEKAVFGADYVRRRLGLTLERLPADVAGRLRLDPARTLWVSAVEKGGPAESSGIVRGQVVTAVDGQPATDLVGVGRLLNRKRAGESVRLDLWILRRRGMMLQAIEAHTDVKLR